MAKRVRNTRKHRSQRIFAHIEREATERRLTIGAKINAIVTVLDTRDPIEMARAANAALKGCA